MSAETRPANEADISRTKMGASRIEAHPAPGFVPAASSIVCPHELFVRFHPFTSSRHMFGNFMGYFVSLRTIPCRCLLQQLAQPAVVVIALCFPYRVPASTRNPEALPLWSPPANMSPPVVAAEHLTFHDLSDPPI